MHNKKHGGFDVEIGVRVLFPGSSGSIILKRYVSVADNDGVFLIIKR